MLTLFIIMLGVCYILIGAQITYIIACADIPPTVAVLLGLLWPLSTIILFILISTGIAKKYL